MHFRSKAPAAPGRHPSRRRDPADRVPSTAWLAAQEAFSAPRPTPQDAPAGPAVVVVRKARAPVPPVPPAGPGGLPAPAPAPTPALGPAAALEKPVLEKPVRVFRVVTVPVPMPAPADVVPALPVAAAPEAAATPPTRRRRRASVAPEKQPGPVLRIVQPVVPLVPPVPAVPRLTPAEELASLRQLMARLDEVLRDIQQARAWRCAG